MPKATFAKAFFILSIEKIWYFPAPHISSLKSEQLFYFLGAKTLGLFDYYLLEMSPSRAGLSHSLSWSIFARLGLWPFFLQLELFFQLENLIHSFFSSNFLFSPPKLVIYNRIEWKLCCFFLEWLIFGVKKENWRKKKLYIKEKIQLVFSSKMKVLLLGSAPSKLGLARAGKIQLELITTTYH